MPSTTFGACLAALVLLAATHARAATPTDAATAQALFDEAHALVEHGKDAEACPKFAESQRLDPSLGTLLRLATCYESIGRSASAWSLYREASEGAKAAGQPAREKYATEHAEALEPKLCRLTIEVPSASDLAGLVVRRDGQSVGRAQWGTAVPIDPGSVSVEASAPGRQVFQTRVSLAGDGKRVTIAVPVLGLSAAVPSLDAVPPRGGRAGRVVGFTVAGLGLVAVAVGSVYGVRAMGRNDDSAAHCRTATLCDSEGLSLRGDARRFATVSTVAFVVGGIGLVGGAVLVLTSKPSGPTVVVGLASSGISLSGNW
jgi:serine/threonine-protein kinase